MQKSKITELLEAIKERQVNGDQFHFMTGRWPDNDDLDRVNCSYAGEIGHHYCGVCMECLQPKHMCLCK